MINAINLQTPYVVKENTLSRLCCEYEYNNKKSSIWFEVSNEYTDYLCFERCDAFVIGLLDFAMRHGCNIKSEAPISDYLLYQLEKYVLAVFSKSSDKMFCVKIDAPIATDSLSNANAVGTGISCGVDSFHVLANHTATPFVNHNITHLLFNNVGSHGNGENAKQLYEGRKRIVEKFCKENAFKLIVTNSNIMNEFDQNHYMTHTYTSCFAILCLQKLFSIYYYASGRTIDTFSIKNVDKLDSAYFDFLLLDVFSSNRLRIYSEGANSNRLDKIQKIVHYKPSHNYLNVCTASVVNCNKCEKCIRTLLALDAIGCLDLYSSVFDVNYYKLHKTVYLKKMVSYSFMGNIGYKELEKYFTKQLTISIKLSGNIIGLMHKINSKITNQTIKNKLLKVYYWFND